MQFVVQIRDLEIVDLSPSLQTAFVRTAINLPAHSLCQTLPGLLPLLRRIPVVVFYCNSCTLLGRGPRSAAWYQDALDAEDILTSKSVILTGGIKEWVAQYGDQEALTTKLL